MASDRVNARLPEPLARHVERVVGAKGLYETPSEYIRSLIRRDMESDAYQVYEQIVQGFQDVEAGRYLKSTGNWEEDKKRFEQKEAENWQE